MRQFPIILFAVIAFLATALWATDTITLQGESAVYTVQCEMGTWINNVCSGKLSAGDKFKYRALTAHAEVLFWIAGSPEPSGKLSPCVILDGRNWKCALNADAAKSVTLEMSKGNVVADPTGTTRRLHTISKFSWLLLKYEVPFANMFVGNRSN